MKRTFAYSISIFLFASQVIMQAQDTIPFVRKLKIGFDLFSPGYYIYDRNNMGFEGFVSFDTDTNRAIVLEAGYLDFSYSQYNYDFQSKGIFTRLGMDFNTLKYEVSQGRYYTGIGLRYGFSVFNAQVAQFEYTNYWGSSAGSVPAKIYMAHFLELTPGIRAELFRNLSIGWTIRLRVLVYSGSGSNFKSIGIPGYGNGSKSFSPGINYYMIWSIPWGRSSG